MGFPATFPATFPNGIGGSTTASAGSATVTFTAANAVGVGNATVAAAGSATITLAAANATAATSVIGAPPVRGFNGTWWPRLIVEAGIGPDGAMVDITTDSLGRNALRSFRRSIGRHSPIDSADPGTCTLVFDDRSGNYDQLGGPSFGTIPLFTTTASDTSPTVNYSISGQTSPSGSGCTNSIVTAVTGGVLHDAGNAAAATPNGTSPAAFPGPQTFWNDTPNGATYNWHSVRQRIRIDTDQTTGVGLYYAHQGATTAANGVDFSNRWYQGLQANGALGGKCWNAAIWNGVDAVAGDLPGTYAGPFSGEGEGYQLQAQFAWVAGRTYTMQMMMEPTRGPRWFAFWIKDETTAVTTWLGSIRAAVTDSSYVRGIAYNFTELFSQSSPAATCPLLPRATTFFGAPTFSVGTTATGLDVGTPIHVLAEKPLGLMWDRYTGTITDIILDVDADPVPLVTITCADGLEVLARHDLDAGLAVFNDTEAGRRINDLAALASWDITKQNFDDGIAQLWPTQELGSTVLDLMQKVEMTEMGLLFVTEDGILTFWDRYHTQTATRSTSTQLTLADTGVTGVVRMANVSFVRSRDGVYNSIHLTRDPDPAQDPDLTGVEPGDEPAEMFVEDANSIATVRSRLNLPADVAKLHSSDAAVLDQANMLLDRYKDIQDRVSEVPINCLHPKVQTDGLWPQLLALTLLDRISVSRDYGPNTLSAILHVQAIEEEVVANPPSWTITLTTSNVPPTIPRFIVGVHNPDDDLLGW